MNTDPFMQGLFPQLGLTPEKSNSQNNGCGFTMVPNADLGNGYLWTYPVNPYFSVTIYHLTYYKEMHYRYHHPAMLVISLSSPIVAKAVSDKNSEQKEQLLGYYLPDGKHEYTLPASSSIDSVSIAFTPEFYNSRLSSLYDRDFSDLPRIAALMNGTINIPSVISIFKEIADYTPIIATSELFYEAKALELIACLVDWHIRESLSPSVRSICDADREAIHRLIHFLQQHYCESLDVKNIARMCQMSKSKLSELFHSVSGVTLIEFINNLRIERAKELLINSYYQIGEISAIIGYAQQSSFTYLFKQKVGMSPRDYRKLHKKV